MHGTRHRSTLLGGALLTASAAAAALLIAPASQAFPGLLTGSFRSGCEFSHALQDDPIVSPGQPGTSHLHDFFGNVTTDSGSTYESLRAGGTTCDRKQDTAAYWAPALYQDGQRIRPGQLGAYYRGASKDSSQLRAMPADLRMIAGNAHNTDPANSVATWTCEPGRLVDPVQGCPPGSHLQVNLPFPDCWDGVHLDSADHKSHMAYAKQTAGPRTCPASHPVAVPMLVLEITYPGAQGGSGWSLASGPPASFHADFLNAWDQRTLENLIESCVKSGVGAGTGVVC